MDCQYVPETILPQSSPLSSMVMQYKYDWQEIAHCHGKYLHPALKTSGMQALYWQPYCRPNATECRGGEGGGRGEGVARLRLVPCGLHHFGGNAIVCRCVFIDIIL